MKKPERSRLLLNQFHCITLVTAAIAGITTFLAVVFGLPAWTAFLGWVGYSLSGRTTRENVANLMSLLVGVIFGVGTGMIVESLTPVVGIAAMPLGIFGVSILVMSLRTIPPFANTLACFLGLISVFASNKAPSLSLLAVIVSTAMLGALSACTVMFLESRLRQNL